MNKTFAVILCLVLSLLECFGQATEHLPQLLPSSYTVYDIEQGLPSNCVEKTFFDPQGRLWLNHCIKEDLLKVQGFFMYDGNKHYEIQMHDTTTADPKYIYRIDGVTQAGILYGKDETRIKCFLLNTATRQKQFFSFGNGETIAYLVEGDDGQLFVLTQSEEGWFVYELKAGAKKLLAKTPQDKGSKRLDLEGISGAVKIGSTIWFVNNQKGFVKFDIRQQVFEKYFWKDFFGAGFSLTFDDGNEIHLVEISADNLGNLLFFVRKQNGFFYFDVASGVLKAMQQVNDFFQTKSRKGSVFDSGNFFKDEQGNTVLQAIKYHKNSNGNVVFSSYEVLLDKNGNFHDYTPIGSLVDKGRFGESAVVVTHFFSNDFKKDVIISTSGGVFVADLKADYSIINFFRGRPARALVEIDARQFLVINERNAQFLINRQGEETNLYETFSGSIGNVAGFSQLIQKDGAIWFATPSGELGRFDPASGSVSYDEPGREFEKFNFVGEKQIAFVDKTYNLFFYDLPRKELRPFLSNGSPLNIQGTANELYVSRDGLLWIASLNGLWKINHEKGVAEKVSKENGFQDDRVMCIQEASDGKLWIGTYSGGIHIYNPKSGSVQIIDENDGLSNNTVVGLLQDNEGYWWAATYDGLTVLSENGRALFELSENEGISHREFNRFSYLKTSDGKLLFGTVDGVNLLDPEKIKAQFDTKESLQIYLTDITYFDKKTGADIHWKDQSTWPEQIIIPADKRYIEVDFGLSSYNNPDKNNFLYRISRTDQELETSEEARWTSIGYNSELVLNNLPTGDFTILIKALNYKGQWTEEPLAIQVSVQEFFYKTWWFYLLVTIPILGAAWFWIRRLSTEKKRMEAEVEKRTLQIQQDKALIEKQAAELKELDELKSRFFTNISHEFRTPLTVISGMITQMEQQPERWMQKGIELIKRNSHQLLSLINQILDLRKLESGALQANLIQADVIPFLQYLADSFVPMAQSKGIRIHFLPNCSSLEMDYDPDKLLHILSNLLSNAIKYTPGPGGGHLFPGGPPGGCWPGNAGHSTAGYRHGHFSGSPPLHF